MIRTRIVPDADWPSVCAQFRDPGFEQSLTYARPAAARIGGQLRLVVVERDGIPLAAAAVRIKPVPVLGRGIAWIPSGPLVLPMGRPDPDCATLAAVFGALRDEFCLRRGHILRLRLAGTARLDAALVQAAAGQAGFTPTDRAPGYRSFAIDARLDPDALMRQLNGKWRTDLRFAVKSDLSLDRGAGAAMISRFMALYQTVQTVKGFNPDITPAFHFNLIAPAQDYALDILIATKDGQDLAGIVTGTAGRTATYLFGATADAGRPLRAGYFLQWEGIALARQRGLDWYDLGGVDFDANPDVARFKERMGGAALASDPYEAAPGGLSTLLIRRLETLRARLKTTRPQKKG